MKEIKTFDSIGRSFVAISQAQAIVMRNINRIPGQKKHVGNNVFVCCPSPKHNDRRPSCSIYLGTDGKAPIGYAYCFGCEFRGPWNRVAEILKLDTISVGDEKQTGMGTVDYDKVRSAVLSESAADLDTIVSEFGLRGSLEWDRNMEWRGINGRILRYIGSRFAFDERVNRMVLIVPVTVDGEIVGAIKCSEDGTDELNYLNSKGTWVRDKGLFCYDLAIKVAKKRGYRSVVVVEGVRDALRLNQKGIPAIAILGVENWGKAKKNLLLCSGFSHFILAFDSDNAGIECTNTVRRQLRKLVDTQVIKMAEWAAEAGMKKMDPGNMPRQFIRLLRSYLRSTV